MVLEQVTLHIPEIRRWNISFAPEDGVFFGFSSSHPLNISTSGTSRLGTPHCPPPSRQAPLHPSGIQRHLDTRGFVGFGVFFFVLVGYFILFYFIFIRKVHFKPLAFKRSLPLCSKQRASILLSLASGGGFPPSSPRAAAAVLFSAPGGPERGWGWGCRGVFPLPGGKRGRSAPGTSVS